MTDKNEGRPDLSGMRADRSGSAEPQPQPRPRYEKPILRRYDQIEQVRPYGPSEI